MYLVLTITCDGNNVLLMDENQLLKAIEEEDFGSTIEFRDLSEIISEDPYKSYNGIIRIDLESGPERMIIMKGEIVKPEPKETVTKWVLK